MEINSLKLVKNNELLDLVYPIGSVYISFNNTNPSTLFGGEWENISDYFLYGVKKDAQSGITGGSETHDHEYRIAYYTYYGMVAGNDNIALQAFDYKTNEYVKAKQIGTKTVTVNNKVEGVVRNSNAAQQMTVANTSISDNLPPFITCYMWKRIS